MLQYSVGEVGLISVLVAKVHIQFSRARRATFFRGPMAAPTRGRGDVTAPEQQPKELRRQRSDLENEETQLREELAALRQREAALAQAVQDFEWEYYDEEADVARLERDQVRLDILRAEERLRDLRPTKSAKFGIDAPRVSRSPEPRSS
jgi:multidrug efflux pump subunit AcrA (membrane-fusion protein)